jgi:hypothetical protein
MTFRLLKNGSRDTKTKKALNADPDKNKKLFCREYVLKY